MTASKPATLLEPERVIVIPRPQRAVGMITVDKCQMRVRVCPGCRVATTIPVCPCCGADTFADTGGGEPDAQPAAWVCRRCGARNSMAQRECVRCLRMIPAQVEALLPAPDAPDGFIDIDAQERKP